MKSKDIGHTSRSLSRLRTFLPHLLFYGCITLLVLAPLAFAVVTGAREATSYARDPVWPLGRLSLENFLTVWEEYPLLRWFANSLVLSLGSAVLAIVVGGLAAFGFVTGNFHGRRLLFIGIVSLMIVPSVTLIVPLFQLSVQLGWQGTYNSALLIYSALLVPFSVYLLTRAFETVPHELREAMHIDGAPHFKVLARSVCATFQVGNHRSADHQRGLGVERSADRTGVSGRETPHDYGRIGRAQWRCQSLERAFDIRGTGYRFATHHRRLSRWPVVSGSRIFSEWKQRMSRENT